MKNTTIPFTVINLLQALNLAFKCVAKKKNYIGYTGAFKPLRCILLSMAFLSQFAIFDVV